jgi:cell division protein FtsN
MAKKKRRKAGRKTRKKTNDSLPGWTYMLVGLAIGLTVAFAIYVNDRKQPGQSRVAPALAVPAEPASSIPEAVADEPERGITFDFYELLPTLDVEIFEDERAPARSTAPAHVSQPGIYILQAGSFKSLTDANRRKAEIALLGVRSEIKKGNVASGTVYRVYTDPMEEPAEVNRVSNQLTSAGIEIMLKRVRE